MTRIGLAVLAVAACDRLLGIEEGTPWPIDGAGDAPTDASAGGPADGPPMRSCGSPPDTCGLDGTLSCCDSPLIPGGTFYRGYDVALDMAFPNMSAPATVSDFRLDRYEVTVGRFRRYVEAGMGTQANPPPAGVGARTLNGERDQGGWEASWSSLLPVDSDGLRAGLKCYGPTQTWTDEPGDNEHRPIGCVTWYQAMAFCIWDGGFLPTIAEGLYAAGGGSLQRAFPWSAPAYSTTIDCTVANFNGCLPAGLHDVGSHSPDGDGLWGHADLSGNAWEWTLDWDVAPFPTPCTDCASLVPAAFRTERGGSFHNAEPLLRSAEFIADVPEYAYDNQGIRCARAP